MDNSQVPFVLAGMLLFAAALLALALMFARRLVGWPRLEEMFPDQPDDQIVARYTLQSLYVAKPSKSLPGPYIQGLVSLIACKNGLRIAVWPVIAFFFKPIFIPWEAITPVTVTMKVTGLKGFGLQVGSDEPFTLTIIARVARKISAVTNGRLEIPPELM